MPIVTSTLFPTDATPCIKLSYCIVPDSAYKRASNRRKNPLRASFKQVGGDSYVGESPNATAYHKAKKALEPCPSPESPVTVSQHVIEREVENHGDAGSGRLGCCESPLQAFQQ
jgi:hypothetical protein